MNQSSGFEGGSGMGDSLPSGMSKMGRTTNADRKAAAARLKARRTLPGLLGGNLLARKLQALLAPQAVMDPLGKPDYFGTTPNWANSQLPSLDPSGNVVAGTGIRKFVDSLPGLGAGNANNLGNYISVANPDTTTYPGSDYYVIAVREYHQKLASDIPTTTLRGYVQLNYGTDGTGRNTIAPAPIQYLGPTILATRNRPVRVKFVNELPTGTAGDLFIPTDTTVMGAGMGPDGVHMYTQNRATLHLHGGATPWISDGTPNQWVTPATENTPYPKGVSVTNVPDMWYNAAGNEVPTGTPNATTSPGPGAMTFFYTNQQSARLMFYHDHSYGITRLNVYAGEAAGYLVSDPIEQKLIAGGTVGTMTVPPSTIPTEQVPLIIQDKTFVPDASQLATEDPTWAWGGRGGLWFPHVYMPNQNPSDSSGANAMGRWDYGPWFWPPMAAGSGLAHGETPAGDPGTPNPSIVPEAFMDTPMVNGTPYPYLHVSRKAYRFRILNACNDRMLNLQIYYAKSNTATVDASGNVLQTDSGEVPMVPAAPNSVSATWPATWPTDGRAGGVPDPLAAGPNMIQIGHEGGFLPKPVVLENTPVGYNYNRRDIVVLNISNHTLLLGPAERADVIVDFSNVPAGSKLILYNDAPAPVPAFDTRLDYYTGDPDQTDTGGAPTTQPGYGPNTRTVMQFQVGGPVGSGVNTATLDAAMQAAFKLEQDPIIVPETAYGSPTDNYSRIQSTSMTFTPDGTTTPINVPFQPKAIQELFELNYGRMNATLGVELPFTNFNTQTTIPLGYLDPATENIVDSVQPGPVVAGDGTQIWKITHNGVDTHAIHFHLFNVQVINRVGWDGAIRPPDANELGWKETVRMNPLEDCIVALRPVAPTLPFKIGDSIRPLDPTQPLGAPLTVTNPVDGNAITIANSMTNFGWEYVWHCHLLGHEENDMMRPMVFEVSPAAATALSATPSSGPIKVTLKWSNHATVPKATNYLVQRALDSNFTTALATFKVDGTPTSYVDTSVAPTTRYYYRVRAENANSYSAWTNTVSALTPALVKPIIRLSGSNRYATAVAMAADAYPSWTGVKDVVIASGETAAQSDSLAAPGLAGAYDAPFLLVSAASLNPETKNAINAMPSGVRVHIIGGTTAVSTTTFNQIKALPKVASVERITGADRYATAVAVDAAMKTVLGANMPKGAIVLNGADSATFYDGFAAGAISAKKHFPVLLVTATSVPSATNLAMESYDPTTSYVVGGTSTVSNAVLTALAIPAGNRISGANRFGTAVAVATRASTQGWLTNSYLGFASTTTDAQTGGAYMGKRDGSLLYVNSNSVPGETSSYLTANRSTIIGGWVFGGTSAVTDTVKNSLQTLIQ